ncbi:MAG: hypothetical protein AB7F25_06980 [Deferribacterales bacterium]
MATYREYAKENGHTDAEIEEMVEGLFGADAEMVLARTEDGKGVYSEDEGYQRTEDGAQVYNMGNGYTLYVSGSSYDIVGHDNGETWELEY